MHSTAIPVSNARRLWTAVVMFAVVMVSTTIVTVPAFANHGTRDLEVEPEVATGQVGTGVRLKAYAVANNNATPFTPAPADPGFPFTVFFDILSGPALRIGNGPTITPAPGNIDTTCTITSTAAAPSATCSAPEIKSSNQGTMEVRAWITHPAGPDTTETRNASTAAQPSTDCTNHEAGGNGADPINCPPTGNAGGRPERDDTDVVSFSWVQIQPGLDCNPESQRVPTTSTARVSCTLRDDAGNPEANKFVAGENMWTFQGADGANDPDNAAATPADYRNDDASALFCRTGTDGTCTGTIPTEGQEGTAHICLWADDDAPGGTADHAFDAGGDEADGGRCDEEPVTPGTDAPRTDAIRVSWEEPEASGLQVEPDNVSTPINEQRTFTATVYDQFGEPFVSFGTQVRWEFFQGSVTDGDGNNPEQPDYMCQTVNTSGCNLTYPSTVAGSDVLCVWLFALDNDQMTGNVSNPSCLGEGLTDTPENADPEDENDRIDVVRNVWTTGATPTPPPPPPPPPPPAPQVHQPALVRHGNQWFIRGSQTSGGADIQFSFGNPGDFPVFGDWNGDGRKTPGVVRGTTFYLSNENLGDCRNGCHVDIPPFSYGNLGDIPIVGDWDGNGTDTIGVVRGATWYLRNSNSGGVGDVPAFVYGNPGDRPMPGDWDGNNTDTPAMVRGTQWFLRQSNNGGGAHGTFFFGNPGDIPVVGDWDGNGTYGIGVFRGGNWYLSNDGRNANPPFYFGSPDDRTLRTWRD